MSIQAAQEFRQRVSASPELQEQIAATVKNGEIDLPALVDLGRSNGFAFSVVDAENALASVSDELSDFEMELVAGGRDRDRDTKFVGGQMTPNWARP